MPMPMAMEAGGGSAAADPRRRMAMEAGGGSAAAALRRRMAAQRAASQRQISHAHDRAAEAASAFTAALLSARSLAANTISLRATLNGLKDQLRSLEANLAQALSTQASKGSKHKLITESVLNATATNEQLRSLVMDRRATRDEYASVVSDQLQAIEALEASSDVTGNKKLEEAVMWYNKFLGFQVVGGEGVKFVFNKIDMQSLDNEYLFCIKLNKDSYRLLQCVPHLKDSEELMKDLNLTNDLFKFVRIMRERFQAAAISGVLPASPFCPDTPSITTLSPPALSVYTTSESITDQSHSRSQVKNQGNPKRRVPPRSAASPHTMLSSTRRSSRFAEHRC